MFNDIPILTRQRTLSGNGAPRLLIQTKTQHSADGSGKQHEKHDQQLAERIGLVLHNHYRGHFWKVHVDSAQGVAMIKLAVLMGDTEWFIIKLRDLFSDPDMKCVMRAGGNLLERHKMPRSTIDMGAFLSARTAAHKRGQRFRTPT